MIVAIVFSIVMAAVIVAPVAYLIVQAMRSSRQRIVLHDGELSIDDSPLGAAKVIAVDRIGAVVLVRGTGVHLVWRSTPRGIWTWGGLLVLDTTGRVVGRLTSIPGVDLPVATIAPQIPAPVHRTVGSRRELLTAFPHALGFLQLRGATWWTLVIVGLVCVGLVLIGVIAGLAVAVAGAFAM